jgi:hypothetical protein
MLEDAADFRRGLALGMVMRVWSMVRLYIIIEFRCIGWPTGHSTTIDY